MAELRIMATAWSSVAFLRQLLISNRSEKEVLIIMVVAIQILVLAKIMRKFNPYTSYSNGI